MLLQQQSSVGLRVWFIIVQPLVCIFAQHRAKAVHAGRAMMEFNKDNERFLWPVRRTCHARGDGSKTCPTTLEQKTMVSTGSLRVFNPPLLSADLNGIWDLSYIRTLDLYINISNCTCSQRPTISELIVNNPHAAANCERTVRLGNR